MNFAVSDDARRRFLAKGNDKRKLNTPRKQPVPSPSRISVDENTNRNRLSNALLENCLSSDSNKSEFKDHEKPGAITTDHCYKQHSVSRFRRDSPSTDSLNSSNAASIRSKSTNEFNTERKNEARSTRFSNKSDQYKNDLAQKAVTGSASLTDNAVTASKMLDPGTSISAITQQRNKPPTLSSKDHNIANTTQNMSPAMMKIVSKYGNHSLGEASPRQVLSLCVNLGVSPKARSLSLDRSQMCRMRCDPQSATPIPRTNDRSNRHDLDKESSSSFRDLGVESSIPKSAKSEMFQRKQPNGILSTMTLTKLHDYEDVTMVTRECQYVRSFSGTDVRVTAGTSKPSQNHRCRENLSTVLKYPGVTAVPKTLEHPFFTDRVVIKDNATGMSKPPKYLRRTDMIKSFNRNIDSTTKASEIDPEKSISTDTNPLKITVKHDESAVSIKKSIPIITSISRRYATKSSRDQLYNTVRRRNETIQARRMASQGLTNGTKEDVESKQDILLSRITSYSKDQTSLVSKSGNTIELDVTQSSSIDLSIQSSDSNNVNTMSQEVKQYKAQALRYKQGTGQHNGYHEILQSSSTSSMDSKRRGAKELLTRRNRLRKQQ